VPIGKSNLFEDWKKNALYKKPDEVFVIFLI